MSAVGEAESGAYELVGAEKMNHNIVEEGKEEEDQEQQQQQPQQQLPGGQLLIALWVRGHEHHDYHMHREK